MKRRVIEHPGVVIAVHTNRIHGNPQSEFVFRPSVARRADPGVGSDP